MMKNIQYEQLINVIWSCINSENPLKYLYEYMFTYIITIHIDWNLIYLLLSYISNSISDIACIKSDLFVTKSQ